MQFRPVTKFVSLLGLALALTLTGLQCTKGVSKDVAQAARPVTLNWWRVFDDQSVVQPIIDAYRVLHPNVTIQYRKLRFEEYERELLNALAEDRGPDIISLHNTWIRGFEPKLAPFPPSVVLAFQELRGSLKKEVVTTLKTVPMLSLTQLQDRYVDTVYKDTVISSRNAQSGKFEEAIYGLPLALDTLALYYNRDMLNLAGIPEPPKTWEELQNAVKKITKLDDKGNILTSAAALGGARNVERAADILALLMMQNGAEMFSPSGGAVFDRVPLALKDRQVPPGEEALIFYADFANPLKEVYTWNEILPPSLTAFANGNTAMMLGYAYHLPQVRARAPRMNLGIAPAPQVAGNPVVNFASYWVEAVSKKSKNQNWAWDFIRFATSAEQAPKYMAAAGKPTALRALIGSQLEDRDMGVFASQVLTAKSWYQGTNSGAADSALKEMIDAVLTAAVKDPRDALRLGVQKINQTLR